MMTISDKQFLQTFPLHASDPLVITILPVSESILILNSSGKFSSINLKSSVRFTFIISILQFVMSKRKGANRHPSFKKVRLVQF